SLLGSPTYMAPEQMASPREVDARADIWALGVVLYELLSGEPPFRAESVPRLCMAVMNQPAPPLEAPDVPAPLRDVVLRCLEKEPDSRFQSAEDLAAALAPYASHDPDDVGPSRVRRERAASHAPKRSVIRVVAGVLIASAVGGGALARMATPRS